MDTRNKQISQALAEYTKGRDITKFENVHIQNEPELMDIALEYLAGYSGDLEFMNDLKNKNTSNLSQGQARGVLNVALAQNRRSNTGDSPFAYEVNGLAMRGYYKLESGLIVVIKSWRADGTSVVGYIDPISNKVEGFGSVFPGGAKYQVWGRFKDNHQIKQLAEDIFLNADGAQRSQWGKAYADATGKCAVCGERDAYPDALMCEKCAEQTWEINEEEPF